MMPDEIENWIERLVCAQRDRDEDLAEVIRAKLADLGCPYEEVKKDA